MFRCLAWMPALLSVVGCGFSTTRTQMQPFVREVSRSTRILRSDPRVELSTEWDNLNLRIRATRVRTCTEYDAVEYQRGTTKSTQADKLGYDFGAGAAGLIGGIGAFAVGLNSDGEGGAGLVVGGVAAAVFGVVVTIHGLVNLARSGASEDRDQVYATKENDRQTRCEIKPLAGHMVRLMIGAVHLADASTGADGTVAVSLEDLGRSGRVALVHNRGHGLVVSDGDHECSASPSPWVEWIHDRSYEKVTLSDSIEVRQRFLQLFQDSPRATAIDTQIRVLQWKRLRGSKPSVEALVAFARLHPETDEAAEALSMAARMAWSSLGSRPNEQSLIDFLDAFSASDWAPRARIALEQIRKAKTRAAILVTRDLDMLRRVYDMDAHGLGGLALKRARSLRSLEVKVLRQASTVFDNSRPSGYKVSLCSFESGRLIYSLEMTGLGALQLMSSGFEEHSAGYTRGLRRLEAAFVQRIAEVRVATQSARCSYPWYF
jgi:hypothetical protein